MILIAPSYICPGMNEAHALRWLFPTDYSRSLENFLRCRLSQNLTVMTEELVKKFVF